MEGVKDVMNVKEKREEEKIFTCEFCEKHFREMIIFRDI